MITSSEFRHQPDSAEPTLAIEPNPIPPPRIEFNRHIFLIFDRITHFRTDQIISPIEIDRGSWIKKIDRHYSQLPSDRELWDLDNLHNLSNFPST